MYRKLNKEEADMVSYKNEINGEMKLLVLDGTNEFFEIAKEYAEKYSSDKFFKLASVIVKDGEIIGKGSNISTFHEKYGCNRKDENGKSLYKSGEGYEVCPGCNPETAHSESDAIKNAIKDLNEEKLKGATLLLYGHFWACPTCWNYCKKYGIKEIIVQKSAFIKNIGR